MKDITWLTLKLSKKRTNLPVVIFISEKLTPQPIIRFFDSYKDEIDENEHLLIPITISNNPTIPQGYKPNIAQEDINKLKQWIILNYNMLIDLYNNKIDQFDAAFAQQPLK